jgi:uncharacterized protein YbjT (DUF2867 family)
MKTLVIGGTGTVGSQVVKELVKNQRAVRVLTTSATKAAALPPGVEAVIGDLDQPDSLPAAFDGVDRVFMLNAHCHTEVAQAYNAIAAAKRAGVRKLVYQSIHRAHESSEIFHAGTKVDIEKAVEQSGLAYTFICPNNFYQNDFWFKDAIRQYGIYPQPIGDIGMSRVDVRDIAEVAVLALFSAGLDGQSIPLVGPEVLNGPTTAKILSEQLGFPVSYAGNDLVSWAEQSRALFPAWKVEEYSLMYHLIQEKGIVALEGEVETLTNILGRMPRSYAAFLDDYRPFFQPDPVLAESESASPRP